MKNSQFDLKTILIATTLAGLSLTLLLLAFDSSRRLDLFALPPQLLGGLFYLSTFCLLLASPILLIWFIKPLFLGKRSPFFLLIFLLASFVALLLLLVDFGNIRLLYERAPLISPILLSLTLLNVAEVVARRLDAFYTTCWIPPLLSLSYWFFALAILSAV